MEQLSFLHQLVKMLLNGSKWNFSSVYLRNKKKIIFIFLLGRRLLFGPAAQAGPACLRARRPLPCAAPDRPQSSAAACPYAVVVAHRVDTGDPRAPPVAPTPTAPRLPPPPPSHLLSRSDSSNSASACLRHRSHQRLSGVGSSGH